MKTAIWLMPLFISSAVTAQTPVDKSLSVQPGQKIEMHFDYPELIRVSTWEKSEISIKGTVSINEGENDDAFELETGTTGHTVWVRSAIRNMSELPKRMTIRRNGQKITFKTKADYKKYEAENGKEYTSMSLGIDMEILLEIKVPKNMDTRVESVYGMVEIKEFTGPLIVEATYGGVDAALTERTTGELIVETNYGQIYTNLTFEVDKSSMREENFHTYVSAHPGTGPRYGFESKYGNVYLRRSQ